MLRLDKDRGVWIREWKVKPSYSPSVAAAILGRSQQQVAQAVASGDLVGPGSTADEPVDHDKLAIAAASVGWKTDRARLRREVDRLLREVLHADSSD